MSNFLITEPYEKLLLGVYQLYLATAEQLCRIHWSPNSITMVKARLKDLVDNGYLLADKKPSKKPHAPYYYTLATGGMTYLKENGYAIPPSMRADKEQDRSYAYINHTLEVNDVILSATLLSQQSYIYRLHHFIHERELKGPKYKYDAVPDAVFEFRMTQDDKERRATILLEHDRATEHINAFKPRIRAYKKMLETEAHKELYRAGKIRIAFTTLEGENHVKKLMRWTKEELTASLGLQEYGGVFYFTHLAPAPDPKVLWLEPVWKTLYTNEQCSLLD